MKKMQFLILLLSLFLFPLSIQAQDFGQPKLAKKESQLLKDRLRLYLPEGFEAMPARAESIMSATEAEDKESRFIWEKDGKRVVVLAKEYFLYGSEDLESDLTKVIKNQWQGYDWKSHHQILITPLKTEADFKVYQVSISPLGMGEDFFCLGGVVALNQDTTLQGVFIYTNAKASAEADAIKKSLDASFKTLKPGSRKLNLVSRNQNLKLVDSKNLSIQIPSGYVWLTDVGPDFLVHRFFLISSVGQYPGSTSLGIYSGFHPSFPHSEGKKIKKKLFGKEQDWLESKTGAIVTREVLYPSEGRAHDHVAEHSGMLHVFYSASDMAQLAVLEKMVESLSLSESK